MQNALLKMVCHISKGGGGGLAAELNFYNTQNVLSDHLLRVRCNKENQVSSSVYVVSKKTRRHAFSVDRKSGSGSGRSCHFFQIRFRSGSGQILTGSTGFG